MNTTENDNNLFNMNSAIFSIAMLMKIKPEVLLKTMFDNKKQKDYAGKMLQALNGRMNSLIDELIK